MIARAKDHTHHVGPKKWSGRGSRTVGAAPAVQAFCQILQMATGTLNISKLFFADKFKAMLTSLLLYIHTDVCMHAHVYTHTHTHTQLIVSLHYSPSRHLATSSCSRWWLLRPFYIISVSYSRKLFNSLLLYTHTHTHTCTHTHINSLLLYTHTAHTCTHTHTQTPLHTYIHLLHVHTHTCRPVL